MAYDTPLPSAAPAASPLGPRRARRAGTDATRPATRIVSIVMAGLAIVALAGAGALLYYHHEARKDYARLRGLAELKAGQVAVWLEERTADARFVRSSSHWAGLFRKAQAGDRASLDGLHARMEEYQTLHRYGAILMIDPAGELAFSTGELPLGLTPALRQAARRASTEHRVVASVSTTADLEQPLRIEFLAPLPGPADQPAAVVVLVADPVAALFPTLVQWPYPNEAPSIALVRREGTALQVMPVLGSTPSGSLDGVLQLPPASGVLESGGGTVVAAAPVRDTAWVVAVSVDRGALLAEAREHAFLIGLVGALGLFALALGAFMRRQHEHRNNLEELVEERTRELERMVANLETFNYTISHDLRAPLRAINGFAAVLAAQERQRLSPEGERLLGRIRSGSSHMDRLLNDILEYSRVDRAEPLRAPVDLRALVDEVVRDYAVGYPYAQVVVGNLPLVQADATMMRQVFSNLVGNALKFSAASPAPRVEIGAAKGANGTEIYVRDNGAGFDMQYAAKLFKLFQRMHSDSEFPGTGVGLAIVKRLIEHHGGSVRAESTPGSGAAFYFTLAGAS